MTPTHAGKLRHRVRVESPTSTADTGGQPAADTWETVLSGVWAAVEPVMAREDDDAGRATPYVDATELVTVRFQQSIADAGAKARFVVLTQNNRILYAVGMPRDPDGVWLRVPCKSSGRRA
jgi:head-tail adaptor